MRPALEFVYFEPLVDGRGGNVRHKPQFDSFLCQEAPGPAIMAMGRWTAGNSDQMGSL